MNAREPEAAGGWPARLAIARRDGDFDETAEQALDQLQLRVHPTLVPESHPLASVNDVYNAILIEGDPIGQVMFFGPGAGEGPTASAVVLTPPLAVPPLSCTWKVKLA